MVVLPWAKPETFLLALILLFTCCVNCSPVFTKLKNKSSFNGRKVANVDDEPHHQQITPSRQPLVINDNLHAPPPTRHSSPTRSISGHLRSIPLDSSGKAAARLSTKANGRSVKVESDEEEGSTHNDDDDDYYHDFAEAPKRYSAENSPSGLYHSPWSDRSFSARYPTANQITEAMQNRVQQSQGPRPAGAQPRPRMRTRLDYYTPFMGFAPPLNYGSRH